MNGYKQFVPSRTAQQRLGVHSATLREWDQKGYIKVITTPGGHRLYDVESFINDSAKEKDKNRLQEKRKLCYCRVSSVGQKDDLNRQIEYMRTNYPDHQIISDIGSGINFSRKGLRTILELSSRGIVQEVVVAYRDRLCRFAFELIEWILSINGTKLVVLNKTMETSQSSELAEDLLAIINVFNCRVNGRRKYNKEKKEQGSSKENVANEDQEADG